MLYFSYGKRYKWLLKQCSPYMGKRNLESLLLLVLFFRNKFRIDTTIHLHVAV